MSRQYESPVNCVFAEGVPTGVAAAGSEWVDTLTDTLYKYYGGAWHALGGGGGGGFPYWNVGPYSTNLYSKQQGNYYSDFYIYAQTQYGQIALFGDSVICQANAYAIFAAGPMSIQMNTGVGVLNMTAPAINMNLPTAPGAAGSLWNSLGVVTVA